MKYEGNLIIENAADAKKYRDLTEVAGDLYIHSSAKLDALKSVGGYLYIHSSAKLDAPKLESVGGYLSINSSAKLDALKSVGGDLYIHSSAKLDALKSVGGYLYIHSSAKLDALKSVGGYLYIHSSAKLDAPKLESVGGYLCIHSSAKLDAPKFYSKGFDNFKVYDGIACVVLSSKNKDGVEILSCRHAKIKQGKLIGEKFFVAKNGNVTAHAEDIKTALEELAFKTGNRDVSQYKNMPSHTRKAPKEWAFIYRMITGACQFGTQRFMESKGKLKKSYTLAEIAEQTRGAFGNETFRKVCGIK